jgi:ribonuclease HI
MTGVRWETAASGESVKTASQLYLLDGSSYIYRAYYGVRDVATAGGMPTNAVLGFTRMLLTLLQENRPDYLAVVFDPPREETFRREIYPEYKANRDAMPADLVPQIPYIRKVLQALNIQAVEAPGFEADDVIATLARRYAVEGALVTVVTGDKDLLQIVCDRISLLDTMKEKRSGPQEVLDRFGVPPELVADVLGLAGDTADNIPGVPGIGEKTASELVRRFGSLEEVLQWRSMVSGKQRRGNLRTHADQARLSKVLATVRYDVPLDVSLEALQRQTPNLSELIPLLRELEFAALELAFTPPPAGVVEIYSDGSGRESGPGGYGVILRYGEFEKELSGFEAASTSQRMELIAAIRGLEALTDRRRVRVHSDSQYLVRGMSEWLRGWIRSGRLETPEALKNQDLWQQLAVLSANHEITWEWVRGHAGHHFNERCDRLAKRAADEGMRAAEEKILAAAVERRAEESAREEKVIPLPVAPVNQAVAEVGEVVEYEADDDGQLLLC